MLRSVKYGMFGAVLAGLIAAPLAWGSVDKSIRLVVDGHPTTVRTTASDVGALLDSRGYHVDSHDLVAPATSSSLHNGMTVVLRRGRLLHLDVDGRRQDVWTTAPTVRAALAQLGYATQDFVSVSRSRRLPLVPSELTIRTPHQVTIVHDGVKEHVTTTDATVGALLADVGVTVGPQDRLQPSAETPLADGQRIRIQRFERKRVVHTHMMSFPTKRRPDSSLYKGTSQVAQAGRQGMAKVTYAIVYLDGKKVATTKLHTVVVRQPQPRIVDVGTKPVVTQLAQASGGSSGGSGGSSGGGSAGAPRAPIPSPGSAQAIAKQMLAARGWGDPAQFNCLVTLWNHESGWRVNAANPSGAYGIPQALPGSKMASAGPDWQTNAATQITWGLNYIHERYGTPCGAWTQWQANGGWY